MKTWLRTWGLLAGIGRDVGPMVCLLFIIVSATAFIGPLVLAFGLRPLVDGAVAGDSGGIVLGCVLSGLALLLTALAPVGYRWATIRMRERSHMVVQRRLLALSATTPGLEHFESPEFRDRLQLLKHNCDDLADGMTLAVMGPLVAAQLLVTATLLGRLHPLLPLVPVLALPAAWLAKRAEALRAGAELRTAADRRTAHHLFDLAVAPDAGMEVRIHGLQQELVERHERASRTQQRVLEAALFRSVAASTAGWLTFAAGYAGAVVLVLRQVARGAATAGDLALTLGLATATVSAAMAFTNLTASAMRVHATAGHYHWLESRATACSDLLPAETPDRLVQGIELDGVTFTYAGNLRPALRELSLHLPSGSVVALVGENGAGKTTLVKLLCGMYTPTSGRILVDGTDLTALDIDTYRTRLTAAFQDSARFELPVRESVGVGDLVRAEGSEAVPSALAAAGADFVERLPGGLDTPLGSAWQGGVELSGGQWQRLALARAMMRTRPLLTVLDEPAAALDPHTEHTLFERIASDARLGRADGRITLLISHRFSTVRMADLIVVLDGGRIAEMGSHEQLLAANGLYSELYAIQAIAYSE
ncbi:ABC transporter ATP-binding protein [Streptomyces sp. NPDC001843]|uniref:ABC transporter ATP-binding protein n=1 Tax=Streptomyces sp. NPDC001843 TaxID=3364617 RepID=UPI0036B9F6B9